MRVTNDGDDKDSDDVIIIRGNRFGHRVNISENKVRM